MDTKRTHHFSSGTNRQQTIIIIGTYKYRLFVVVIVVVQAVDGVQFYHTMQLQFKRHK